MPNVDPGEPAYADSDRIPATSANGSGARGNAVAFNNAGELVLTSGSNGFAGIQGATPTEAGDEVPLQVQGITPAYVSAAVEAGQALSVAKNGELAGKTDGSGNAVMAGPGELRAMKDSVSKTSGEVVEVLL